MSRRIEIELTSARPEGGYTWRAAGAREPRGVLGAEMTPSGAKVGTVLRVEIEADIDGISILSVLPSRAKNEPAGLIEVKGTTREFTPVTTTLVSEKGRPRGDRRDLLEGDRPRRPRPDGSRSGPPRTPRKEGEGRESRPPRRTDDRRPAEGHDGRRDERRERPAAAAAAGAGDERPPRDASSTPRRSQAGPGRGQGTTERPAAAWPARARPPRFVPGTTHRDEVLAGLPAEQRPIADQLVSGGLAAVRQALAADASNNAAILALAEQMLPAIKEAVWLDRAEAAVQGLEHLSLRELRTTVTGALPRDDHGRELDRTLRTALDERLKKLRDGWHDDMARALDEGRVLQALRLSARPPEPAARFPADLVTRLSEATGTAMAAETPAERWMALLEAATASPVRRYVKPAGIATGADEALLKAAGQAAGRIPALAGLLGMPMPPPPGPAGAPVPPRRVPARPPRPARPVPAGQAEQSGPAETTPAGDDAQASAVEPSEVVPGEATLATGSEVAPPVEAEPVAAEPVAAEIEDDAAASETANGGVQPLVVDDGVVAEEVPQPVNQG